MDSSSGGREDRRAQTRGFSDRRSHHRGTEGLGLEPQPKITAGPAAGRGDARDPSRAHNLRDHAGMRAAGGRKDF